MRKFVSWVLQQPFYLWLLGVFPILHLYSVNIGLVIDHEVATSLVGMLAVTAIAFVLTNSLVHDRHITALMLAIASICFSFSGHIYIMVFMPGSLFVWTLLIMTAAGFLIAITYRIGAGKSCVHVTRTLNLISMALLISPTIAVVSGHIYMSSFAQISASNDISPVARHRSRKVNDSPTRPDIYYIIPDSYPSDDWLQEAMNYDNSAFTNALLDRGFVIAEDAQSNYGATLTSLASVLNMQYYDKNPSQINDLDYLRLAIAESEVARQLQKLGYTYLHLLSGLLLPSSIADLNRDYAPAGPIDIEVDQSNFSAATLFHQQAGIRRLLDRGSLYKQSFISLYVDTTWLRVVKSQLDKLFHTDEFMPYHVYAGERFLATVDDVESFASLPEATFAIVHLLKPHFPVVFNESGDTIPALIQPNPQQYFEELRFVNSRFLQLFDTILENSPNPPVVIFQADHGSTYGYPNRADKRYIHFDTYAAYYLPDGYALDFPRPYTLINSFPLILNEVFATDYELQEDRLMELLRRYRAPFEQRDVTDEFLHQ